MSEDNLFRDLFSHAFELHLREFSVRNSDVLQAMYKIQDGYSPQKEDAGTQNKTIDYSDPALRCAYLHKYAGCHAAMVERLLLSIHYGQPWILSDIFFKNDQINVCCLGGGPGSDVIGMSSVFSVIPECSATHFNFTIVDKMHAWVYTYETVMTAAESGRYGRLGEFLSSQVTSSYQGADIVSSVMVPINAVRSANIVTMIKFVSAVESADTLKMLQRIFEWLKPGALVLFIDNDGGGTYQKVSRAASKCNLEVAFGPIRHFKYENDSFRQKLFGISSLTRTTVSVQMWRKPETASSCSRRENYMSCEQSKRINVGRESHSLHRRPYFPSNGLHDSRQHYLTARQQQFPNDHAYGNWQEQFINNIPYDRHQERSQFIDSIPYGRHQERSQFIDSIPYGGHQQQFRQGNPYGSNQDCHQGSSFTGRFEHRGPYGNSHDSYQRPQFIKNIKYGDWQNGFQQRQLADRFQLNGPEYNSKWQDYPQNDAFSRPDYLDHRQHFTNNYGSREYGIRW